MSRGLPDPIEHLGGDRRLAVGEEAAVVLHDHVRRVLDRVARLFVGPCLLQDMDRQDIAHIVRTVLSANAASGAFRWLRSGAWPNTRRQL